MTFLHFDDVTPCKTTTGYQLVCSMQSRHKRLLLPRGPACIKSSLVISNSIGEQGGGSGGVLPRLKKKIMTPSKIQNDPHPLRNGF